MTHEIKAVDWLKQAVNAELEMSNMLRCPNLKHVFHDEYTCTKGLRCTCFKPELENQENSTK